MKITRRKLGKIAASAALSAIAFQPARSHAQAPAVPGDTPRVAGRTIRLFLIGNSFSQNATRYLPQLAKAGGHELIIGRAELPGAPLQRHWQAVSAAEADSNDPKGQPYKGKSLRMLLETGRWDIVTIQQASIASGAINSYQPYARQLYDFIKQNQPNAEVVLHQTWAYRADAKYFSDVRPDHKARTQQEMWQESRMAYHETAGKLKVRIIPTGDAFWKVDSDPEWGYRRDTFFNFAQPVYPNLPDQTRSLHAGYSWRKNNEGVHALHFDANHASDAGSYLGGLVWYGFLFNESPEKLTFVPPTIPAPFAAHLRKVAWQTVQNSQLANRTD